MGITLNFAGAFAMEVHYDLVMEKFNRCPATICVGGRNWENILHQPEC